MQVNVRGIYKEEPHRVGCNSAYRVSSMRGTFYSGIIFQFCSCNTQSNSSASITMFLSMRKRRFEDIIRSSIFLLCVSFSCSRANLPRGYFFQPVENSRHVFSCTPLDPASSNAFGGAVTCMLKPTSGEISGEFGTGPMTSTNNVQLPTYVKVSSPLLYKPLPRTSSLIYVASPIVKSASAVVATEPKILEKDDIRYTAYPRYSFNYGVIDGYTGDSKSAWEERNGDTVKGEYSVVEADGAIRTVSYTADDRNGFNAVVTRSEPPKNAKSAVEIKTFVPVATFAKRKI